MTPPLLPLLSHGLPPLGFGTYELRGDACTAAVRAALQMGYRLLDTAAVYRNEALVGQGIVSSGVPRAELFVVVKIAMKSMSDDATVRQGILDSIDKLRIGYADCVLMHWPGCGGLKPQDAAGHRAARARCWRIMHALQAEGKVRHCGVSNFLPRHFKELQCFHDTESSGEVAGSSAAVTATDPPAAHHGDWTTATSSARAAQPHSGPILNQIELHPLCVQRDVDAYCRQRHGMVLQQYSPLAKGDARLLAHPQLLDVYTRYFVRNDGSAAAPTAVYSLRDVLLMWGLSQGYCTLVRSQSVEHIRANLAAARDYFASVCAAGSDAAAVTSGGETGLEVEPPRSRPRLTPTQLDVIHRLRTYMGLEREGAEEEPDLHTCWFSAEIA